jgi:hypothetical protein
MLGIGSLIGGDSQFKRRGRTKYYYDLLALRLRGVVGNAKKQPTAYITPNISGDRMIRIRIKTHPVKFLEF